MTAWRIALGYIAFSVLALSLFAIPLWDGWRANIGTFRTYVPEEMQVLADLFQREGAAAVTDAVRSRSSTLPGDAVMLFAGPDKAVLAGTLRAWPAEVPDTPGTYGVVIDLGANSSMRVVASQVSLPGGYRLLMGRESVRFESLVERFWYGMAAALAVVLALGAAIAWLIARRSTAVREFEERYALAMEAAGDGHTDWNLQTGEHYISPRLLEICGYAPGTTFRDRAEWVRRFPFHPEDRPKWEQAVAAHFAGREAHFKMELRIVVRGEVRWTVFHFLSTRDAAGTPIRWTGSIGDITEQKRAEEALRLSESRYAVALEAAEEGHWDWNVQTDEIFASAQARRVLGVPQDAEFRTRSDVVARVRYHPDDWPRISVEWGAALAGRGAEHEFEYRILRGEEPRWIRGRWKVFRDAAGVALRVIGIVTDITQAKLSEEALHESQVRYERAMLASKAGIWDWDAVTNAYYISPRLLEMLGFAPGTTLSSREEFIRLAPVHPEDLEKWQQATRELFGSGGSHLAMELRVIAGGETRWVLTSGICFRDAAGRVVRWTGSASDVTEQKCAEEALRESQERYALAVAGSDDGVWDVDFAARRVFLSARARELSGLPPGPELVPFDEFLAMLPIHPEDVPRRNAAIQAHLAGKTAAYEGEFRLRQRDGVYRWRRVHGICVRDANGQPQRMAGSFSDIDARRRAEDALRLSEERYALALEASAEGYFDTDLETGEMFVSARLNEIYGFPGKAKLTNRVEYLDQIPFHPDDRDVLAEIPAKDVYEFECRIVPRPGAIRWIHTRGKVIRDAEGRARRRVGVVRDITDRKQALETLRESEARFRAIAELSSEGYWEQDENLRFIPYTGTPVDIAGYATDDRVGKTRWELQPEAMPLSGTWQEHQSDLAARRPFRDFQYRRMRPDGEIGYYSASGVPLFDDQGRFKGFFGVASDITERKRFEEELRSRKEMLELAQKSARAVPWEWKNGAPPEVNRWSPELAAMFGVSPDAFDGTVAGWWRFCHPYDVPRVKASIAHTLATGEIDAEYRVTHPDGKVRWLNQKGRTFFDANGNPERSIGFMFDITERRKVEEDLRSRQEMLDLAQKSARVIAFEWNIGVGEGENRWSPDLEAMYGFAPGTYDGSFESWKKVVHPEDWPAVQEAISHAYRTGEVAAEYRVVHPDGSVHWLQARGRMFFDAADSPSRMVGFMQDVTERQQAETDMRKLEQELRRAQRLEAMGTLAGGIAHDFNNILGAILGYGEMAMRDAKKGTRLRRDLDSILAAGERGRSLVDRILAFSRSGIGERVPVHVEAVAREALDQLAAKLPPNVTIAPRLHAGRAAMLGDSTQVHQVVMNLVTNAVQAMPQGGVLRVSLELARLASERAASVGTLSPGEYLVLRVKDSGTGIPAEVLERMFDPFFTTKEIGVGSGLGLSLVHGIVTSVGGAVDVATELGKGTTFTVYLRRSGDAPEEQVDANRPLPRGEGQRVLVVDDEEPLARLATETLELLGYAPVAFTSSTAALAAFRADPQRFDAVLTDERMPGLSGSALIREVRGIREAIPVVLMSGYLGMKSVDADVVVRKPLSASELAASMARALQP